MLTLDEILDALGPCWRFANQTTEDGTLVRPDYRRALDEAWTDIVVAAETKRKHETQQPIPHPTLNVAMVRRERSLSAGER
jgi:hypothetical protein